MSLKLLASADSGERPAVGRRGHPRPRLAWLCLVGAVACASSSDEELRPGARGGACVADELCDFGLSCQSGICADGAWGIDGSAGTVASGGGGASTGGGGGSGGVAAGGVAGNGGLASGGSAAIGGTGGSGAVAASGGDGSGATGGTSAGSGGGAATGGGGSGGSGVNCLGIPATPQGCNPAFCLCGSANKCFPKSVAGQCCAEAPQC